MPGLASCPGGWTGKAAGIGMKGAFITVEGSDGAGKTTHMTFVHRWLLDQGVEVTVTREPGGTVLGERIRNLLLGGEDVTICDDSELLLMFAARMQHIEQVINPALGRGHCVLCDRFTDATYAYQGGGRGIPARRIGQLEEWVQKGLQPDLTILLDVSVGTGLKRTRKRGGAPDRFERQSMDFKQSIRQVYLDRAAQCPGRMKIIDSMEEIDRVQHNLSRILAEFFDRWH